MKRIDFFMLTIIVLAIACTKDTVTEHYSFYRPVYKTKEAVRTNVKNATAELIQVPGKIVWKDNYVFVNDVDRGVHIIDISNPAQIKSVSYISIPGCVDLAVYGNYLYADCYTDLVTIDISNPLNIAVKQFLPGVFPLRNYHNFSADTSKIITEWIKVDTVVKRKIMESPWDTSMGGMLLFNSAFASSTGTAGIGLAGSTARFALMNNQRMYAVSNFDLKVFNLTNAASPTFGKSVRMGASNIETIFPYQDKLFIGSQSGMFIYNTINPDQPEKIGQFSHARACDPVIADNGYAYVTLKGGNTCGGFTNQLDVLNVSNVLAPQLVKSYTLTSPTGLSKDGDVLLICDGKDGLKIFNAKNAAAINMISQLKGFEPHDVIAQNGIAIAVAADGLHVIDYSVPANAKEISKLSIAPKQ